MGDSALLFFLVLIFGSICSQSLASLLQASHKAILFNGGGIFFWYQAGICQFLLEEGFLQRAMETEMKIIGTSAGSLSAALLASGADFNRAAEFAIYQSKRDKIFETKRLAFVWGGIVEEWLNELLPVDSHLLLKNTMISATPAEICKGVQQSVLSNFKDKEEVIQACMASVHIPFFMDKTPCRRYRDKYYLDGSFWPFVLGDELFNTWSRTPTASTLFPPEQVLNVDWRNDEKFANQVREGFTAMISPERVIDMMDAGYSFMKRKERDKGLLI